MVAAYPPPRGSVVSIRYDLTDDDLKRFYGLDFWFDPMPLLGFIPQWFNVLAIVFTLSFILIWAETKSFGLAVVAGTVGMLAIGEASFLRTGALRKAAREGGFLLGRQVSMADAGVEVSYSELPSQDQLRRRHAIDRHRALGQTGIAAAEYPWSKFRRVEFLDDQLIFWMAGRSRLVLPERIFHSADEAEAFAQAAAGWIADPI